MTMSTIILILRNTNGRRYIVDPGAINLNWWNRETIKPPGGRWVTYSLKKPQKWFWIFFSPYLETLSWIQPYTSYVSTSFGHSTDSIHIFIVSSYIISPTRIQTLSLGICIIYNIGTDSTHSLFIYIQNAMPIYCLLSLSSYL